MPRRNDIAITLIAAFGLLFGTATASAQFDFDSYYKQTKISRVTQRVASVAQACGVNLSGAKTVYGMSLGQKLFWERRPSLGRGMDEAETDFFNTAEVWLVAGHPRIVNVWMLVMDTGGTRNEMYCLDQRGRVIVQESLVRSDDVEGSKPTDWIYLQRITFVPLGRELTRKGSFVNDRGVTVTVPGLEKDVLAYARAAFDRKFAADVLAQLALSGKQN